MTTGQYVNDALRTESLSPEVQARFEDLNMINRLHSSLMISIRVSQEMDTVKKMLFYGKNYRQTNAKTDAKSIQDCLTEKNIRLLHSAIGLFTEAGELLQALSDHFFDGLELDSVNISEELGDCFWYLAIGSDALKTGFPAIMEQNIEKLRARYPEKFDSQKAINRDLAAERSILEGEK